MYWEYQNQGITIHHVKHSDHPKLLVGHDWQRLFIIIHTNKGNIWPGLVRLFWADDINKTSPRIPVVSKAACRLMVIPEWCGICLHGMDWIQMSIYQQN